MGAGTATEEAAAAPAYHLLSRAFFHVGLRDIISYRCINLLSLGFFPSIYSRNIAEFLHFPCLSCFCMGKAELFEDKLLLDPWLKGCIN